MCWIFLLSTISSLCVAALRFYVRVCRLRFVPGRFFGCLSEFDVGFSCLALLATVRGGTSFLFPTAKKKRSKENAYRRQPIASVLAQPSPWSENRTVLARSTHSRTPILLHTAPHAAPARPSQPSGLPVAPQDPESLETLSVLPLSQLRRTQSIRVARSATQSGQEDGVPHYAWRYGRAGAACSAV
jgi:hypothetical protein